MGRNFSTFTWLFFSDISQCYSLIHFNFCLDNVASSILGFLSEDIGPKYMRAWSVNTPTGTEDWPRPTVSRETEMEPSVKHTVLKSCHFHEERIRKAWGKSRKSAICPGLWGRIKINSWDIKPQERGVSIYTNYKVRHPEDKKLRSRPLHNHWKCYGSGRSIHKTALPEWFHNQRLQGLPWGKVAG